MFVGLSNIPFFPVIQEPEAILFFFYVFLRVTGFFMITPILSSVSQTQILRMLIGIISAMLIAMTLYPSYLGDSPQYILPEFVIEKQFSIALIIVTSIKEFFMGFVIGFCFAMMTEGVVITGQLVGQMMGISVAEMFDPITNTQQPLLSQFFLMTTTLVMLSMDVHLMFWRTIIYAFDMIPIGGFQLNDTLRATIAKGSGRMFPYALQLSAIPYIVLLLVTFALAFLAKVMPEMNIFMVGFPLKILIGFYTTMMAIGSFPTVLKRMFQEYENLARLVINQIANTS